MKALLLHSGGLSGRQWRRLSELLSGSMEVVTPDLLGSGSRPAWPATEPFHFRQDLAELEPLLDDVHLVGHSYGGLLALQLALHHPGRVRSLSLYDPVAFGILHDTEDQEGLRDLARAGDAPVFLDDTRGGGEEWFEAFVDYWNGPGSWKALPEPSRASFLRAGRKVYLEVRSLMEDRTGRADYGKLTVPALVMVGERSPASARRVGAQLAQALPRAELVSVTGAGHMGPISHADQVNALIAEHVQRNG